MKSKDYGKGYVDGFDAAEATMVPRAIQDERDKAYQTLLSAWRTYCKTMWNLDEQPLPSWAREAMREE